jgi:biotin carboxyl carrier protein
MTMAPRTKRYSTSVKGQKNAPTIPIDIETLGDGRYVAQVNGTRYELDSLVLPHGAVSMLANRESYAVEFEERKDGEVVVLLQGQVTRVDVADERTLRLRAATAGFAVEGKQTLTAPMPGKVVKVLVALGQAVEEGQGLVIIEAMKMENELKSPKAGKVLEISIKEGVAVESGARLIVVE